MVRCGYQTGRVVSKGNGGHPPSVYTTVINCALFPALLGKVLENWVGLARWGSRVSPDRFGQGMALRTQRDEAGIGSPALWLQKSLTVERPSFGQHKQGLWHQLSELPPSPGWDGTQEGRINRARVGHKGRSSLAPIQGHTLLL